MCLWKPLDAKPLGWNHMVIGPHGNKTHDFDFIKATLQQRNSIPLSQAVIRKQFRWAMWKCRDTFLISEYIPSAEHCFLRLSGNHQELTWENRNLMPTCVILQWPPNHLMETNALSKLIHCGKVIAPSSSCFLQWGKKQQASEDPLINSWVV